MSAAVRQRLRWVRNAGMGLLAIVVLSTVAAPSGAATPGSAGTSTALPMTESAVTARGRGPFADLEITVNQTEDLVNQAVSITWKGGTPTVSGNASRYAGHYLQIMQCWGDADGTIAQNPGPPPEQCVQGATDAVYGGRSSGLFPAGGFALERIIARKDFESYDPAVGVLDERTGWVWRPFRAVDGTVVEAHYDPTFNPAIEGGQYWLNDDFNAITTNEIAGGRTRSNGTGEELFQVDTGLQSPGLGCGRRVQPVAGGAAKAPRCWIVVVPRGDPAAENEGTPFDGAFGVATSPLGPAAWRHRIAIPLEFTPVEVSCDITREQRRLVGSELAKRAITSWQPALCATPGLPPYAFSSVADATARSQILSAAPGAAGMAVVSSPIDPAVIDPADPVVYAPLTLSATGIGFTIERVPSPSAPASAEPLRGIRVADLNLTPRLVAKLLTQSYGLQTAVRAPSPYEWAQANPAQMGTDPDFLRFNPEFELLLNPNGKNLGGLVLPLTRGDAPRQVWEWIFADREAREWLEGAPDEWGMRVNPAYAASAATNPTGVAFGDPLPDSFPKSDPHCYQAPAQGPGGSVVPPALCATDWLPYAQDLTESARRARAADDGARTSLDPFALTTAAAYRSDGPQILGSRGILAFVDTASAHTYGLQMARLSRAGDDGDDRTFVAPDGPAMTMAVEAMTPSAEPAVLESDPAADAPGAYPLTALTYAAAFPLTLDEQARAEYSAFVAYAATEGQTGGLEVGQLPPGYAPLPPSLQQQAREAVAAIAEPEVPGAEPAASAPPAEAVGDGTRASFAPASRGPGGTAASGLVSVAPPTSLPGETEPHEQRALGPLTPVLALARNRLVVPVLIAITLLCALGCVELTHRPGRGQPSPLDPGAGVP